MNQARINQINQILLDLRAIAKATTDKDKLYAIEQNMILFEATKSLARYLWWVVTKMPRIDPERLLEINDLLPKYDSEMHKQLNIIERRKFPGLIRKIVEEITRFIISSERDLILLSIGSGSMELERQVMTALIKQGYDKKVVFGAVNQSPLAHKMAGENLSSLASHVEFYFSEKINQDYIQDVKDKSSKNFSIIQCHNNIFSLDEIFSENYFDVVYNSLFIHHLNQQQAEKIRLIALHIAKKYFEYDGFKQVPQVIPQSFFAWFSPVLLNGSILSGLRYVEKNKLLENARILNAIKIRSDVNFYKIGHYLQKFFKE